jgi:hypothetical protein
VSTATLRAEPLEVTQGGHVIGYLVLGQGTARFSTMERHERPTRRAPSNLRSAFERAIHRSNMSDARPTPMGLPPLPPGTVRAMQSHAFSMAPSSRAPTARRDVLSLPPGTEQG